ncbi:hypothetical protein ElyMa_005123800 [Elysia marginata]|uniref:Uncharacterized protein n=1 Tax=Elysia marginata TaxID=1093978 RepID=A0AAV4JJQ8_9GAST|nr:hypothetical protein ElyMa_005123800 [Elysia marginata]
MSRCYIKYNIVITEAAATEVTSQVSISFRKCLLLIVEGWMVFGEPRPDDDNDEEDARPHTSPLLYHQPVAVVSGEELNKQLLLLCV